MENTQVNGVFISYRRDDSASSAARINEWLNKKIKDTPIFFDIRDIEPGLIFDEVIVKNLASSSVVLVIIGRTWLEIKAQKGTSRLDDSKDYLRQEIATALRSEALVIPVLVDGARMPASEDLPADIQALSKRQAFNLSHQSYELEIKVLMAYF